MEAKDSPPLQGRTWKLSKPAQDTLYLQRRHLMWHLVVPVPRPLWRLVGKRRLERSLKTRDLPEAQRLRRLYLADFERILDAARSIAAAAPGEIAAEAAELRRWCESNCGDDVELVTDEEGRERQVVTHLGPTLEDIAEQRADKIAKEHGSVVAANFYRAATATMGTALLTFVDAWLRENHYRPRSQDQHRGTLKELANWCNASGVSPDIESITRKVAGRFVSAAVENRGDVGTINRKLTTFRAYWDWLAKRGHAQANPWKDQSLPKKRRGGVEDRNRAFTDAEVLTLLNGDADTVLADFIRIGALSGARIESLAQLKVGDCANEVFNIRRDKTEAGARLVPIHSALQPLVDRRRKGRGDGEWLFPELSETKRGDRSSAISKRFKTYRERLQINDKPAGRRGSLVNFHSFRHWFVTAARRALQPLDVIQQVVGHKRQGITMGVYFEGFTLDQLRECVEAVKLPSTTLQPLPPMPERIPEAAKA